jgi:hypothetical protein
MRRIFNLIFDLIANDITFFRLWMILSLVGAIVHWDNTVLAEINMAQFLIATGVVAILRKMEGTDDGEDTCGDEESES